MMQLSNLAILDVPDEVYKQHLADWPDIGNLYHAENCAYHLFIGSRADFERLPPEVVKLTKETQYSQCLRLEGKEAYAYALNIFCGLNEENRVGESTLINTIRNRWESYIREHNYIDPEFQQTVRNIFKDNTAIRAELLEGKVKALGKENAITARCMAGLTRADVRAGNGASVLLVADSVEHGVNISKILGQHVSRLAITHPDPEVLNDLTHRLIRLNADGKIEAMVENVPWEMLEIAAPVADHVFIDRTTTSSDTDRQLREACALRQEGEGNVFHLQGEPKERGALSQEWASVPGVVSPETISRQQERDKAANDQHIEAAKQACGNCAHSRDEGKAPRRDLLALPHSEYRIASRISKAPKPQQQKQPGQPYQHTR